jgi:hypothetical protein
MWFQLGGWNLRCDRMRCNALHYALSRTLSPREVSCVRRTAPTYKPITPMVRIDAMEQRLDTMLRAINIVQPALQKRCSAFTSWRAREPRPQDVFPCGS